MPGPGPAALPGHVLVATVGTAGDLFPFLAMADALRRRGHPLTFLCPQSHEAHVRRAGFPFVSLVDADVQEAALANPDLWHPARGLGVVWGTLRDAPTRLADALAAVPADAPCALLVHPILVAHAALTRAVRPDVAIVAAYLAPSNLRSCDDPMRAGPSRIPRWVPASWRRALWEWIDRKFVDPWSVPSLNVQRERLGLPPVAHLMDHIFSSPDAAVTLFPEWFARTPSDWRHPLARGPFPLHHPDPADGLSVELERFLAAGAAPVVFTPGSGNRHAAAYFGVAVEAATRAGLRAVLLTQDGAQVPSDLPAHVLWQRWAPLHALLPRASAFVHHGGIGTTAEALRAGVPQLVVPLAHDQFDNGERVQALGAGHVLRAPRLRPAKLAAALRALSSSTSVRDGSRAAMARLSQAPDLGPVADVVEAAMAARSSVVQRRPG